MLLLYQDSSSGHDYTKDPLITSGRAITQPLSILSDRGLVLFGKTTEERTRKGVNTSFSIVTIGINNLSGPDYVVSKRSDRGSAVVAG